MSAATTLTARQLVDSLPVPFREAVLAELLRDKAAAPKPADFPVLTPEQIAEDIRCAADGPEHYMSVEEALAWLETATPTPRP